MKVRERVASKELRAILSMAVDEFAKGSVSAVIQSSTAVLIRRAAEQTYQDAGGTTAVGCLNSR